MKERQKLTVRNPWGRCAAGLMLLVLVATGDRAVAEPGAESASGIANNQAETWDILSREIAKRRIVGRIDFKAFCSGNEEGVFVPVGPLAAPPDSISDVEMLRKIFQVSGSYSLKSKSKGYMHVAFGSISGEFLKTKVSVLKLTQLEQYNPSLAIASLLWSAEGREGMKRLGVRTLSKPLSIGVQTPGVGYPHLPKKFENVTVEEVLDLIARKFNAVVLYGECKEERLFEVRVIQSGF